MGTARNTADKAEPTDQQPASPEQTPEAEAVTDASSTIVPSIDLSPELLQKLKEQADEQVAQQGSIKPDSLASQEEQAFSDGTRSQAEFQEMQIAQLKAQKDHLMAQAGHIQSQTNSLEADTQLRKWAARKVFKTMNTVLIFVGLMLWMYFGTKQGQVEKEVVIALIGSVSVIVGLVGYIVKGLFGVKA